MNRIANLPTAFVTGGTGLVGSHLLLTLVKQGRHVKALKRESSNIARVQQIFSLYGRENEALFEKIDWVDGDMADYSCLEEALAGIDEVYHCAATVSFNRSERAQMIQNNVNGTAHIVNAALAQKVKKFCHVSSIAALGYSQNGEPVTEETQWAPSEKHTGYSISKFYSEMEVWRGIEEGVDAVIVNPSIIVGPGDWNSGSAALFKVIWDGLKFYTKGVTGYVDVLDVTEAMTSLMDSFSKTKNQRLILNGANLSYKDFFQRVAGALGKPAPKYFASGLLLGMVWRMAALSAMFTGRKAIITKESVAGSNDRNFYSGNKIEETIGFSYRDMNETIRRTATCLLKEVGKEED